MQTERALLHTPRDSDRSSDDLISREPRRTASLDGTLTRRYTVVRISADRHCDACCYRRAERERERESSEWINLSARCDEVSRWWEGQRGRGGRGGKRKGWPWKCLGVPLERRHNVLRAGPGLIRKCLTLVKPGLDFPKVLLLPWQPPQQPPSSQGHRCGVAAFVRVHSRIYYDPRYIVAVSSDLSSLHL